MYLISLKIKIEPQRAEPFKMTTTIYTLYFAIITLTITLSKGHVIVPPHTNILHQAHPAVGDIRKTQKLATLTKHVDPKFLPKGLHARIPVLCHIPLSALIAATKLHPHLLHTKILTPLILPVTRASSPQIRSVDSNVNIDKEESPDPQNNVLNNENNPDIIPSTTNSNETDDIHTSNIRSPDDDNIDLDYLTKAANPVDPLESTFEDESKSKEEVDEMQKKNSSNPYQSTTKVFNNKETDIPYRIWTQNFDENDSDENKMNSLNNKMNDYLKIMNVGKNFPNHHDEEESQTRGLRNVLDDFRRSLTQSLIWNPNGKSTTQMDRNQNYNNFDDYSKDQARDMQTSKPADKIWNSATNFAGNVAERAFNLADNFVAAVLSPENIRNSQLFKPINANGYPPEYQAQNLPAYPPEFPPPQTLDSRPQFPLNSGPEYPPINYPNSGQEYPNQPPPRPIGFSNIAPNPIDVNNNINGGFPNTQQAAPPRPFYSGGYYQQMPLPQQMTINSKNSFQQNNPPIAVRPYFKRSPIGILQNPNFQLPAQRTNRQMPPVDFGRFLQMRPDPAINYNTVETGSLVNSALDLAKSIVGGGFNKAAQSGFTLGREVTKAATLNQVDIAQPFAKESQTENSETKSTPTSTDGKTDSMQNNKNNKEYSNLPSNTANPNSKLVKSAVDLGNQIYEAISNNPITSQPIWNPSIQSMPNYRNAQISPAVVGIGQNYQQPFAEKSYSSYIPVFSPVTRYR